MAYFSKHTNSTVGLDPYFTKHFLEGYENGIPSSAQVSVGVDIGMQSNFTVITAMETRLNKQIFMWRFAPKNSTKWYMNFDALEWTFKYFGVPLAVDCTGLGSILPYEMPRRGVPLVEWGQGESKMMWGTNKPIIFEHFRNLIGNKDIQLFNLPEIRDELKKIRWMPQPSGRVKIAPERKDDNDDIAVSLALSCIAVESKALKYDPSLTIVNRGKTSVWNTEEW